MGAEIHISRKTGDDDRMDPMELWIQWTLAFALVMFGVYWALKAICMVDDHVQDRRRRDRRNGRNRRRG